VWPASVEACHLLLDQMHAQNQFLLASLEAADDIVQTLRQLDARMGSTTPETVEMREFVAAERQSTVADVAQRLVLHNALAAEFEKLRDKWNSHDAKMSRRPPSLVRSKWQRRVQRVLHGLIVQALRSRNSGLIICLPLSRSLSLEHQHIPSAPSDDLTREGFTDDAKTAMKARLSLKDWIPYVPYALSDNFIVAALDNLDLYDKKLHTRLRNGQPITSHMIHAVVGERILFDKAILPGPAPTEEMLFRETSEVVKHAALPSKSAVHTYLQPKWDKYTEAVVTPPRPTAVLDRPPAHEDRQTGGRTICVSLPILVGRSTASKVDVAAAIDNVRQQFPGWRKF
jgi:hypothetical protein